MQKISLKEEIEGIESQRGFNIFYPPDLEKVLRNNINKKIKIEIQLEGKSCGEVNIESLKSLKPQELKETLENIILGILKQKDPKAQKAHVVKIIFLPEVEKKEQSPSESPLALDVYVESADKTKEFEEFKEKGQHPKLIEDKDGYYVIFPYPQEFPIEEIGRKYIKRVEEINNVEEILDKIEDKRSKSVRFIITIEDPTKEKENQKIKEHLEEKYREKFCNFRVEFKTLNCRDILNLIEIGYLEEGKIEEVKSALQIAKNKEGRAAFDEKERQKILQIKNKEELEKFLEENKSREIYFDLESRKKFGVIESIYEVYRKLQIYQEKQQLNIDESGRVSGVTTYRGKIEVKTNDNKVYKPEKEFYIQSYVRNKEETKNILITLEQKPLYKIIYIPKEEKQKNEIEKLLQGLVVVDPSYHVKEFLNPLKDQIEQYIKQNPTNSVIELEKNEPKNYQYFFEDLNKALERYFEKKPLTSKERDMIEYIKKNGLTLIGDMAITDPNKFVEETTLNITLNYLQRLGEEENKNIWIRFLVVSPEKFRFLYERKIYIENTIWDRIAELQDAIGEQFQQEKNQNIEKYKVEKENVKIVIVWVNSQKQQIEKQNIETYLNELNKF